MTDGYFDAPVFIKEHDVRTVDILATPYFYNDAGVPSYVAQLPAYVQPLTPAPVDPRLVRGHECRVSGIVDIRQTPPWGVENRFGFASEEIRFEPIWASREAAAAFGITLVEPGQGVQLHCPSQQLAQIEYEYGAFAGHWSPYQGTGNTLLSVVCTDLEHHDFPHIFASTDPQLPLVISVGRYWPRQGIIRLADLWVPRGSALYIPPMPATPDPECIDLHNNRNSARACWGDIEQDSILTHTLLQTSGTFTYWYWNAIPTIHTHVS